MSRQRAEMALCKPAAKERRVFRRLPVAAKADPRKPAGCHYDIRMEIVGETMVDSFCNNYMDFLTLVNYFIAVGHAMSKETQIKSAERILKHVLGVKDVSEYHVKSADILAYYGSTGKILDCNTRTCRVIAVDFQKIISIGVPEPIRCDLFRYLSISSWKEQRDAANERFKLQFEWNVLRCDHEEDAEYELRWRKNINEGWLKRDAGLRRRAAANVDQFCKTHNIYALRNICLRVTRAKDIEHLNFNDVLNSLRGYDDQFTSVVIWEEFDCENELFSWFFRLHDETCEFAVSPSMPSFLYLTADRLKAKDVATEEWLNTTVKMAQRFVLFEKEFDSHEIRYPAFLRSTLIPTSNSTDDLVRDTINTPEFFPVMYMMEDVRSVCKTVEYRKFYKELWAIVFPRYGSRQCSYTKWISLGNNGRKRMDCYEKITFDHYLEYRQFLEDPNLYIYQHNIAKNLAE
jgi:hypothetical protein